MWEVGSCCIVDVGIVSYALEWRITSCYCVYIDIGNIILTLHDTHWYSTTCFMKLARSTGVWFIEYVNVPSVHCST